MTLGLLELKVAIIGPEAGLDRFSVIIAGSGADFRPAGKK
jgi:hypothetical protein